MKNLLPTLLILSFALPGTARAERVALFDGQSFAGWEGNTGDVWRIEDGQIVAGQPDEPQPRNDFLCTVEAFGDFDLRLKYQRGENNGGVQFRSRRVPDHHEVSGYQADLAPGIDGFLYDESRRNRFLALFDPDRGPITAAPEGTGEAIRKAVGRKDEVAEKLKLDDWNHYRIRAQGPRIRLWINGVLTVDYTETDPDIPTTGIIGLQIHGGATQIRYKDITIERLDSDS